MRTTLTLDDDVASKLKTEMRRTGESLKATVNRVLRDGLQAPRQGRRPAFEVKARDLGRLRPGLILDSIGDTLEQLEGPDHR